MTPAVPPSRQRPREEDDRRPQNELAAQLWVVAALLATIEAAWLLLGRIYA